MSRFFAFEERNIFVNRDEFPSVVTPLVQNCLQRMANQWRGRIFVTNHSPVLSQRCITVSVLRPLYLPVSGPTLGIKSERYDAKRVIHDPYFITWAKPIGLYDTS